MKWPWISRKTHEKELIKIKAETIQQHQREVSYLRKELERNPFKPLCYSDEFSGGITLGFEVVLTRRYKGDPAALEAALDVIRGQGVECIKNAFLQELERK